MTMEQIKEKLASMPEEQQDHLAAYMVHLRHLRDPLARQEITRKIDDREPSHWISVEQLKEHWKD
jgi:TorA maturation chaperone TorD